MSSKNNQSSTGMYPKDNHEPTPEEIAKTRMPGKIEKRQRAEKERVDEG